MKKLLSLCILFFMLAGCEITILPDTQLPGIVMPDLVRPPWFAPVEVYGQCGEERTRLWQDEDGIYHGIAGCQIDFITDHMGEHSPAGYIWFMPPETSFYRYITPFGISIPTVESDAGKDITLILEYQDEPFDIEIVVVSLWSQD